MRNAFTATALVLCSLFVYAQNSPKAEQTLFDARGSIQQPVSLPPDILDVVRRTVARNHACGDALKTVPPEKWFSAASIHLHRSGSSELLVKFQSDCLIDSRTARFWIFPTDNPKPESSPRPEFWNTASSVQLLDSYTSDYRDIRVVMPEGDIAVITIDEKYHPADEHRSAGYGLGLPSRKRELISPSCYAEQAVTLTLSAEKQQVRFGEPIHMSVVMKNATPTDLDWREANIATCEKQDRGKTCVPHTGNLFRFVVRDQQGNSVESSNAYRQDLVDLSFLGGRSEFLACMSSNYHVDLSRMFNFSHAGKYTVEVERHEFDDPAKELLKSNTVTIAVTEQAQN